MIKWWKHICALMLMFQLTKAQNNDHVVAEKNPEYPGGFVAFFKLLQKNFDSNFLADDSISGGCQTFHLKFTIDSTGQTKNMHFLYHHKPVKREREIIEALMRDLKLWEPASFNNKPINLIYDLPMRVRFF